MLSLAAVVFIAGIFRCILAVVVKWLPSSIAHHHQPNNCFQSNDVLIAVNVRAVVFYCVVAFFLFQSIAVVQMMMLLLLFLLLLLPSFGAAAAAAEKSGEDFLALGQKRISHAVPARCCFCFR